MNARSKKKTLLEWALEYHCAGINVVKAYYKGKCPPKGGQWERYETEQVSEEQIHEWFGPGASHGNISVVTGPISGGLTVIDFDSVALYEAWAKQQPELAKTVPTVKSGRGYHVYCRSNLDKDDTSTYAEIDIKAKGLVSLPPSVHKSDVRYKWVIPLPEHVEQLPLLDPYELGLDHLTDGTDGKDGTEGTDGKDGGCGGCVELRFEDLDVETRKEIERAIAKTQPTGPGQRHKLLFLLARMLKKIDAVKDKSGEDLMFIADMWHKRALPNIEHKSPTMTRARFLDAWKDAKYPPGEGKSLEIAWANAQKADSPMPELEVYKEDEVMQKLVRLCFELQRLAGPDEEWFIPTQKAPELFGFSHAWLAVLLKTLAANGIIRKTKEHTRGKCSRYVYTGPSVKLLREEAA
ncbi:MAG: bifunctional DNA primase/polymerase [Sedimentisphaerales bacterium]|nr:bifunctional DNA primase/polymerase [Sedimentisphaerales bacterium]